MGAVSDNARKLLEKRYLLKNLEGEVIESPDEMFHRVAEGVAGADEKYGQDSSESEQQFYEMMSNLEFLPNSPTLMNTKATLGQLSACFTDDQPIFTNPGFRNISEIKVGDKLVTHLGRFRE